MNLHRADHRIVGDEMPMTNSMMRAFAAAVILAILAGCAADPRYVQGLEWVASQEQERQRLQAQGFSAYGPGY